MLRRPFCGMAVGLLLGILTAAYHDIWLAGRMAFQETGYGLKGAGLAVCLGVGLVGLIVKAWNKIRHASVKSDQKIHNASVKLDQKISNVSVKFDQKMLRLCLVLGAFVLGWCRYISQEKAKESYLPYVSDGMQLAVQGELDRKEIKNNQYIYELKSCVLGLDQYESSMNEPVFGNRILVYSDSDIASIGEILVLNGTVELWRSAVNEGNFDEMSFYAARRIDFKLKKVELQAVYGKECKWREALFRLRLRLCEVFQNCMGESECGVMATMVLGDKSLLDTEVKRLYQIAGTSHVLAISGLHISVIGMALYHFLRKCRLNYWGAGILASGVMYVYGTMVGMGTSVQRATGMFLLMLFAQAAGRSYDSLNALGFAAFIMLICNPMLLWDAGFQLSFAAVIGVVWVGKAFPSSLAIQLVTVPLSAWYYYEIPLYAMLMNGVILPATGIVLGLGVLGGLAGLWSVKLAGVLLWPAEKLLKLGEWLCGLCAKLPGAMQITGQPELCKMVLYYLLLAGITGAIINRKRVAREEQKNASAKKRSKGVGKTRIKKLVIAAALLIFLFLPKTSHFELDVLDVGQGDGCFLQTEAGCQIFVDGGSSDVKKVGEYRILPFLKYKGVRSIDYWFVSHTDADHISGLLEVLESGYKVKYLVLGEEDTGAARAAGDGLTGSTMAAEKQSVDVDEEENAALNNLIALAEQAGAEIVFVRQGDILHLKNASIRVLSPALGENYADKNARSLVFLYEEGDFSGIFTGDIDAEAERKILAELQQECALEGEAQKGILESVDFYKVAHHGSKYSNSEEFLQVLRPEIATISCGAGNSYGHPHAKTLERLEEAGSEIWSTAESGQIAIRMGENGVWVREFIGGR